MGTAWDINMIPLVASRTFYHLRWSPEDYQGGGDYGWAIDQTTETEWLYNAILAGTTEVRQPAHAYSGLCRDTTDIGNTYVEIDLDQPENGIPIKTDSFW